MTSDHERPEEHPGNFARTPVRDPSAEGRQQGDLPRGWGANSTLVWVMAAAVIIGVVAGMVVLFT
jgi:hypothetical protein